MLNGISSFPVTPINRFGQLDEKGLASLLERQVAAGVSSIGLLGSTGTYMYLSEKIRTDVIKFAKSQIRDRVPLMVGVSALHTMDAIRFAQTARSCGATVGLLAPITYTALSEREVFDHFSAVARLGGLPICIYDNPSTTHFHFSSDLISRLSNIPGVIGIKNALPAKQSISAHLDAQRLMVPSSFVIGYSGDWGGSDALLAGADTWFSVLAGVSPEVCCRLNESVQIGDISTAQKINDELIPLWKLFQEYSSLRVVYEIIEHLKIADAVLPKPLLPVSADARLKIIELVDSYPKGWLSGAI
ncbi:dihydrodipicolinate synthase family protein [Brucellaceae bacterium C25G]